MTDPTDITDEAYSNDPGDLYVNFSDQEAQSESRDIEPLPSGKYLVTITDCELRECGPDSKNPGKPYYGIEFTVVGDKAGGKFTDRKCWTNAMLFSPALYTIEHIMKAINFAGAGQSGRRRVPRPDELIGQTMMIGGTLVGEQTDKKDPSKKYAPKYEPKAFFAASKWNETGGAVTGKTSASAGATSLLS